MRGKFLAGCTIPAFAAVLLALPAAAAQRSVERVRIGGPGVPKVFPRGVAIELGSPPTYVRESVSGFQGKWAGPEYWASEKPSVRGRTAIEWKVKFDTHSRTPRMAAFAGAERGWPYLRKDPIAVPHLVRGHVIGTLVGFTVLDRADPPIDASYEGVLAFPVGHHAYVVVDFVLDDPPADSAGANGTYLVNGSVRASVWAHGQAFWAFSRVRLAGSLPPHEVKLRVSRKHVLRGRVTDRFDHPVVRARVSVERRTKRGWREADKTRTNRKGKFSVRVGRRAVYRVVARLRQAEVQSRRVLAGPPRR